MTARITALRPGQSPPPGSRPTRTRPLSPCSPGGAARRAIDVVRRTLPFALAAAILLAPVLPARASTSAGDDLRRRRSDLLARIADLTDRVEADQARVVLASDRRRNADAQLMQARRRVRERAVA